jgi:hypothetical protein
MNPQDIYEYEETYKVLQTSSGLSCSGNMTFMLRCDFIRWRKVGEQYFSHNSSFGYIMHTLLFTIHLIGINSIEVDITVPFNMGRSNA